MIRCHQKVFPESKPDVDDTKSFFSVFERRMITMKTRAKQRANRKLKLVMLDRRDIFGVKDPTPHEAVKEMIEEMRNNKGRRAG